MKHWLKVTLAATVCLPLVLTAALLWRTRKEAHGLISAPMATRNLPDESPGDYNMIYEELTITSADGLRLAGWFIPSKNGAVIMMQHGYKATRDEMLNEAEMVHRHGYAVLITSIRAHDLSEGEEIYFGLKEMQDLDAWYQYLLNRQDIDPDRIGILGNSYGGMLSIGYAAQNENIKAVVADSAFSSLNDTVATSVKYFTGLPEFPFVPLIVFWAEQEAGFKAEEVDATRWIAEISPRPVFLMQGGADVVISPSSGQRLFDAAGQPKELWFEPQLGHVDFDTAMAEEFERRIMEFFDKYLIGIQ